MRILVADQNALLLAAIAATFGGHCEIVTATRRDACMQQVEERKFDVVVACEKLTDYTGLELLSEVEAASPETLRIFAARPESLKRLGKQLDFFGLLGTLSYPIDARKLLVALKVARSRLPRRPKPPPKAPPPVVRHVVLETEWDTGERLALLEHELEGAPAAVEETTAVDQKAAVTETATVTQNPIADTEHSSQVYPAANSEQFEEPSPAEVRARVQPPGRVQPPIVESPTYCGDAAANDELFPEVPGQASVSPTPAAKATTGQSSTRRTAATTTAAQSGASRATTPSPGAKRPNPAKGPRARTPSMPTATQLMAFQHALARRNAAKATGAETQRPRGSRNVRSEAPQIDFSMHTQAPALPSQSLADLARMATTKRPLPGSRARGGLQSLAGGNPFAGRGPKRKVFVVGSGVTAVLLVGVVCFELLRASPAVEHGRHAQSASAQLFSPNSTLMADGSGPPPAVFSPPPPQPAPTPAATNPMGAELPQPQTFDPDTAPPDPPPPPALEHPGPMEPPSMVHNGPPMGMQGAPDSE